MNAHARIAVPLAVVLLLLPSELPAAGLEYPEVYRPPAAMAMGGAGVATAGRSDALFTNPAGLAGIDAGWTLRPLDGVAVSSQRTESFIRRVRGALDVADADGQREALVEVMRRYRGQNVHGEASLVPGLSWRGEALAVSVAWLASVRLDGRSHEGFGDEGLLSVDGRTLSGPLAAVAWTQGNWRVGAGVKQLRRNRVNRTYSVRELVDLTAEGRSIRDDRLAGSDVGFDLGVQYDAAAWHAWRPRLGLTVHNVGDLDFGPAGRIPQTVTPAVAVHPRIGRLGALTVSVEYFDVLHRMPQDDSHLKRLRVGAELPVWARPDQAVVLRAGVYQRAATLGAEWRWRALSVGVASYAGEQGAYAGQDRDRRFLATLGLTF